MKSMRARDYEGRLRDSALEIEIASHLRQLQERERCSFVSHLLEVNEYAALDLASRTIRAPEFFERLLERGLASANAHTVKFWLACVAPRLGVAKVLRIFKESLSRLPSKVPTAAYHLACLVKSSSEREKAAVRQFVELLCDRGLLPRLFSASCLRREFLPASPLAQKRPG